MGRFSPGDIVSGLFAEGQWYLATVKEDNGDDTYTVEWFDGDESNRTKPSAELKLMRFDSNLNDYYPAGDQEAQADGPAATGATELVVGAPAGPAAEPEEPGGEAVECLEGEGGAKDEGEDGEIDVLLALDDEGNPMVDEEGRLIVVPPDTDFAFDDEGNPLRDEEGNMVQILEDVAVDDDGNPILDDEGNLIQIVQEDSWEDVQGLEEAQEPQELQESEEPQEPQEVREPGPVGTLTLDDGMCLYINLDRREDRKQAMEQLAAPNEWLSRQMTRISAVNGGELSWPQLVQDKLFTVEARIMSQRAANMNLTTIANDPDECSSHLTLGGCGCALSHRKAWQALLDSQAKWALVLEDDLVAICQDFDAELKAVLQELPEDFSVCYLGFHSGEPLPEGEHFQGPLVQQEEGWLAGLWCYLISRSGAQLMLEQAVPFQAQVDTIVGILAVQDGRCYTVPPGQFLAFSPPTEESLDTDVQTYRMMPETEEEMMQMMEAMEEEGQGATMLFSDIALHDAALQGLSDVCMEILGQPESVSDLNARDGSGQTVLHAAAWAGLTDVCTAIMERSDFTEVNAVDDEGNSVLHAAAFRGLTDVCLKILERPEFTEVAARDCDERPASSLAEEKGYNELADTLRKRGA